MASEHALADRIVDFASVALISAAAVLSALCSYQATRWSGDQARLYNVSNVQRLQAADAMNRGLALTAINVNLFLNYLSARETHDSRKADFLYKRMPSEMRKILDAWIATNPLTNPHAASSPFAMHEYTDQMLSASRGFDALAAKSFDGAQLANQHSDNFMLLTVVFAGVSFLGGMSTKMTFPRHAIIVAVGALALVYGLVRLAFLPFL